MPALFTSTSTGRVAVGQSGFDPATLFGVHQIGRQHLDLDLVRCAQVGGRPLETVDVPSDQDEVMALGREESRERRADPGGRAGDECRGHALHRIDGAPRRSARSGQR